MKYNKNLPLDEKRHFMKCSCGEYFDMRDLNDVMAHFHKSCPKPQIDYSHSIKVGEPFVYANNKKIGLN